VLQALSGLVIASVIKYADNILKTVRAGLMPQYKLYGAK
jgi:hypothetical protein